MNPALRHPLRHWRWQRSRRRTLGDWPAPGLLVEESPLLAIDLEMTGLDPVLDEIVSIGWVPIDAGVIVLEGARECRLARCRRDSVGASATIHGLRDCDLADAESPEMALRALESALHGRVAVFHHAPLDLAFLERSLTESLHEHWQAPVIDTLAWHRRRRVLWGADELSPESLTLGAACRQHRLIVRSQHNALADALTCAELLLALARNSRSRLLEVARPPRAQPASCPERFIHTALQRDGAGDRR